MANTVVFQREMCNVGHAIGPHESATSAAVSVVNLQPLIAMTLGKVCGLRFRTSCLEATELKPDLQPRMESLRDLGMMISKMMARTVRQSTKLPKNMQCAWIIYLY